MFDFQKESAVEDGAESDWNSSRGVVVNIGKARGVDNDLFCSVERLEVRVVVLLLNAGATGGARPQLYRVSRHHNHSYTRGQHGGSQASTQQHQVWTPSTDCNQKPFHLSRNVAQLSVRAVSAPECVLKALGLKSRQKQCLSACLLTDCFQLLVW